MQASQWWFCKYESAASHGGALDRQKKDTHKFSNSRREIGIYGKKNPQRTASRASSCPPGGTLPRGQQRRGPFENWRGKGPMRRVSAHVPVAGIIQAPALLKIWSSKLIVPPPPVPLPDGTASSRVIFTFVAIWPWQPRSSRAYHTALPRCSR